jgi:tubulin-specific chaperone D
MVLKWIEKVDARLSANETGSQQGFLAALGAIFHGLDASTEDPLREKILNVFVRALQTSSPDDVDIRVAALTALDQSIFSTASRVDAQFSHCLIKGLQDHTINERGDVGSLVRHEALAVVRNVLNNCTLDDPNARKEFLSLVAVLAGEKLDKMRFTAWECLQEHWQELGLQEPPRLTFDVMNQTASEEYFHQLLGLLRTKWLRSPVVKGFCSSAGSGSESVLRAARAAFSRYLLNCTAEEKHTVAMTLFIVLRDTLADLNGENIDSLDHITLPILEMWAFLFQTHFLHQLEEDSEFPFGKLLRLVQKAHYRSNNVQKLTAAVSLYQGLQNMAEVRMGARTMLTRLMLHPQPKVRNAAADAFYLSLPREELLQVNWSGRPADLKGVVTTLRGELGGSKPRSAAA